ncbi:exported hypothetical protein [uncultured Paludibacter sp.]|uniref:HIRAN domain-containing protein n=1 Tax=uncultured Paludibacter sp. TaxID=497635 RepID=A0A653AKH4_9BACT|nr:exported hypothetical protein [uncultured Paludibacter sp.]
MGWIISIIIAVVVVNIIIKMSETGKTKNAIESNNTYNSFNYQNWIEDEYKKKIDEFNEKQNDDNFETGIVRDIAIKGLIYKTKKAQKTAEEIEIHSRIWLEREPRNKYDKNAVRVEYLQDNIGYIDADDAPVIAELIDRGAIIDAFISNKIGITLPYLYADVYFYFRKLSPEATLSFREAEEIANELESTIRSYRQQQKRYLKQIDNNKIIDDKEKELKATEKLVKFKEAENKAIEKYNQHCDLYRLENKFQK